MNGQRGALVDRIRDVTTHRGAATAAVLSAQDHAYQFDAGALSAGGTLRLLMMLPLSTLTGTGGVSS